MSNNGPSLFLDQARLTFIAGLIALVTVVWSVFGYFKDGELKNQEQDARIGQSEINLSDTKASIVRLTEKTDELTQAVVRLTAVIENRPDGQRAFLDSRLLQSPLSATPTDFRKN